MESNLSVSGYDACAFDADKSFTLHLRRQYRNIAKEQAAKYKMPRNMLLDGIVWKRQGWRPEHY